MIAQVYDIDLAQGASWRLSITVNDKLGAPRDLTGCTARMDIRARPGAAAAYLTITEVKSPDGRITVGTTDGTLDLFVTAEATMKITKPTAAYDLFLDFPNGEDVWQLLRGTVTCEQAVTTPTHEGITP